MGRHEVVALSPRRHVLSADNCVRLLDSPCPTRPQEKMFGFMTGDAQMEKLSEKEDGEGGAGAEK